MPPAVCGQNPPEKEKSRTSRQSMPRRPAIHAPYSTWYLSTVSVSHMAHVYLTTRPVPCQLEISRTTIICVKYQFFILFIVYIVLLSVPHQKAGHAFKSAPCSNTPFRQAFYCRFSRAANTRNTPLGNASTKTMPRAMAPAIFNVSTPLNRAPALSPVIKAYTV